MIEPRFSHALVPAVLAALMAAAGPAAAQTTADLAGVPEMGIDARVNAAIGPVADVFAGIIFYSVPVMGADLPLIVVWLITAALFMLGRWAIGMYMARAAPGSAYGSMGTLVILLVWMYYAAMVFFVGALITAVIDERAQIRCGEMPPEHEDCWPQDAVRPGEQAEPQVYPTTLAVEPGARPPVASPPDRTP